MIVRIDARRLTDAAHLHAVMHEAFGFTTGTGKNLDALVDCLTHLDDPKTATGRLQVFPGTVVLLVIEHMCDLDKTQSAQARSLIDAVNFVNYRRFEQGQPPILAVASEAR